MKDFRHALPRFATCFGVLCLLLPALLLLGTDSAMAGDRPTKLERQIDVMEGAIDDMLVDSPNFLVAGRHVTEGFDAEDYGVLFSFQASLTGLGWDEDSDHSSSHFWPWNWDKKHRIIVLEGDDGDEEEFELDDGSIIIRDGAVHIMGKDARELKKLFKNGRYETIDDETYRERQLKKYDQAKEELIDVFMEYGEILKELSSGQTVRVVARLHDIDFPKEKEIRRLSLSASIDDLRAYGDGRLSESEMRDRIKIRES